LSFAVFHRLIHARRAGLSVRGITGLSSVSAWCSVLVLALAASAVAGDGPRKPKLDVRATPRFAFSPVDVRVMVKLVGGDEHESYYCPALQWEWGDGSVSSHEADCPPFEEGMTLERHFTAQHAYRRPGDYDVRVTLSRAGRALAVTSTKVLVQGRAASADTDW
jgi:hypothetical protein